MEPVPQRPSRIIRALRWLGLAFVAVPVIFLLLNWIFPVPDRIEYSTVVTDRNGEVIHAYLTSDQKWRMRSTPREISPLLQKTIIAREDKYFLAHHGVDPLAAARAFFTNLFTGQRRSGASTITMQVAKALEPGKRNLWSKLREMFRALQLELKYNKGEILQMYFDLVPYGGNIEGVKTAALLYLNKAPDHLSLAEITALSVIPNKPSLLVPGRHNDRIVKERNRWLQRFAREKVFTEKEIADALAEPFTATRGTVPRLAPHLSQKLKQGGSDLIHSHLDMELQLKTEKMVADYVRIQRLSQIRNAAVVVIDNKTHQVITYVGSSGFFDSTDGGQVNGAAAVRQPGSTLKPLLYALCFDEGLLTPKSVMNDVPVNYDGYTPENYDGKFNGYVSAEFALEHSLNIPAVRALRALGTEKMIQKLGSCGFTQVSKDRRKLGLSLVLGGCGTRLEELTGLFSVFANEGFYFPPSYSQEDRVAGKISLISPAAAYMTSEILTRINRPDFPVNWTATERMPRIAWKTGTSYGRKDAWSIGYNRNYTIGVWLGNFSGQGVPGLSGANVATPLLFRLFNTIDYDPDAAWFAQPGDCELRQVCSETGKIPGSHCTAITSDYFIPLISSSQVCDNRAEILTSADGKISYCRSCVPEAGYRKKWMRTIEPEMQAWFTEHKIGYEPIPPHNPDCEVIFRGAAPVIHFPVNGSEYYISSRHPEPLQLICRTANDVSQVHWYINDRFYKSTPVGEKQFFLPEEGPVKITVTDDKGRSRTIRILVRLVDL